MRPPALKQPDSAFQKAHPNPTRRFVEDESEFLVKCFLYLVAGYIALKYGVPAIRLALKLCVVWPLKLFVVLPFKLFFWPFFFVLKRKPAGGKAEGGKKAPRTPLAKAVKAQNSPNVPVVAATRA